MFVFLSNKIKHPKFVSSYFGFSSTCTAPSSSCDFSKSSLPLARGFSSSNRRPSSSSVGPLVSGYKNQMIVVSIASHTT